MRLVPGGARSSWHWGRRSVFDAPQCFPPSFRPWCSAQTPSNPSQGLCPVWPEPPVNKCVTAFGLLLLTGFHLLHNPGTVYQFPKPVCSVLAPYQVQGCPFHSRKCSHSSGASQGQDCDCAFPGQLPGLPVCDVVSVALALLRKCLGRWVPSPVLLPMCRSGSRTGVPASERMLT